MAGHSGSKTKKQIGQDRGNSPEESQLNFTLYFKQVNQTVCDEFTLLYVDARVSAFVDSLRLTDHFGVNFIWIHQSAIHHYHGVYDLDWPITQGRAAVLLLR